MKTDINNVIYKYMKENYDYLWLRSRLELARHLGENGTLIVGSSHALNGIDTYCFDNAVNCSMHTQDIYYDLECLKNVLSKSGSGGFSPQKCFIVFGYYIPFQEVSLGRGEYTINMVRYIFDPVFKGEDDITWEKVIDAIPDDDLDVDERRTILKRAYEMVFSRTNYYNDLMVRGSLQKFSGKWKDLDDEQKKLCAQKRASDHNRHIKYKESFERNKAFLKEAADILTGSGIRTIIVIPPFTNAYNEFIETGLKTSVNELAETVRSTAEFVDFNKIGEVEFNDDDFVDTDHLNGRGAYKLSTYLAEMFGR